MNIVACIKQTPDSAAKLAVTDNKVTWGDAPLIVNPWDEYAYEEALLLKEKYGGKVTAVSMGSGTVIEALKTCLAVGLDEAILISDPALQGSDGFVTTYCLAKAVQKIGDVDLVLLGRQAIDSETGLTPSMLARNLGWTLLTQVIKIHEIDESAKTIKVERLMEEGRQVCSSRLPAVVSVIKGINEPRYPSFMGIRKAAKASVPVWTISDLGIEGSKVGTAASVLSWPNIYLPPTVETKVEIIQGDSPQEIAGNLVDRVIAEKII